MKRFFPYLYPAVIYLVFGIMLGFEIDLGPFISIALIGAAGIANILYSFQ